MTEPDASRDWDAIAEQRYDRAERLAEPLPDHPLDPLSEIVAIVRRTTFGFDARQNASTASAPAMARILQGMDDRSPWPRLSLEEMGRLILADPDVNPSVGLGCTTDVISFPDNDVLWIKKDGADPGCAAHVEHLFWIGTGQFESLSIAWSTHTKGGGINSDKLRSKIEELERLGYWSAPAPDLFPEFFP